jgi:hypothetical protein
MPKRYQQRRGVFDPRSDGDCKGTGRDQATGELSLESKVMT